jgi:hypothetical protein
MNNVEVFYTYKDSYRSEEKSSSIIVGINESDRSIKNKLMSMHRHPDTLTLGRRVETARQGRSDAQSIIAMSLILVLTMFVMHMIYVIPLGEFNPHDWEQFKSSSEGPGIGTVRFFWHCTMTAPFMTYIYNVIRVLRLP